MNYHESETYLLSLGNEVEAMKLGLDNIRKLLVTLGNPEKKYLKVQIAGTNGKGSVCAFLDSICLRAGIKTGAFTSPHLMSITERVRIGGVDISENEFARIATQVRITSEELVRNGDLETVPTYFEQVTAIALLAFAEAKIDLAILETGLGGRYDAVTATNAEICAITRIDLDHQKFLGNTIEEIAAEKAAIIRADSLVVALQQQRSVDKIIDGRCRQLGVRPNWATKDIEIVHDPQTAPMLYGNFATRKDRYLSIEMLFMPGEHQFENASVAIAVAEELQDVGYSISNDEICVGVMNARHPGRLEYIGRYLLDGAHNIGSTSALAAFLDESEPRQFTLIFGAMKDKNVAEMLEILLARATRIVFTESSNSRSIPYKELLDLLPQERSREGTFATNKVENAINIAETVTPGDGLILVTGSLYLAGEVKRILEDRRI